MIKVKVENLGIIKEADIELKPFTVFIGENNTNKSWLAYTIFGLFSPNLRFSVAEYFYDNKENYTELYNIIETTTDEGYVKVKNFAEFVESKLNLIFKVVSDFFKHNISNFFSLKESVFKNFSISVSISEETLKTISSEFSSLQDELVLREITNDIFGFSVVFLKSGNDLVIKADKGSLLLSPEPIIITEFVNFLLGQVFKKAIVLPAERKGSTLIEENLSNIKSFIADLSIELEGKLLQQLTKPSIGPLEEFVIKSKLRRRITSNKVIESFVSFMEEAKRTNKLSPARYLEFANQLSDVLGGEVSLGEDKQIYFSPSSGEVELPFHSSSSLVKSLVPFQLYLEKFASGRDLIVMDEPEMNLHPKAQLQLLEALVSVANGLQKGDRNCVLITTHTPYFLEYLEVMLEAAQTAHDKPELKDKLASLFEVGKENALIPPDKVAVYQFTPTGEVISAFDRENLTIELKTFSNASRLISEKSWEIDEMKEQDCKGN
jgi:predicted ATPase